MELAALTALAPAVQVRHQKTIVEKVYQLAHARQIDETCPCPVTRHHFPKDRKCWDCGGDFVVLHHIQILHGLVACQLPAVQIGVVQVLKNHR
jgi:hypothetical protein